MGSVFKRNNAWYVSFQRRGKQVRKKVGPNKEVAQKALRKAETEASAERWGVPYEGSKLTLEEFAKVYEERHAQHKRSADRDERTLRLHLIPKLGKLTLYQITQDQVAAYRTDRLAESAAPATVNRETALLRTMFNLAELWGRFSGRNPTKGIKPLRERRVQRILKPAEQRRLLASLPEPYLSVVSLLLLTGLRKGELFALRWEDVSPKAIRIRDSKSGKPRVVPLSQKAREVLRRCGPKESGLVFPPEDRRAFDYHWRKLRKKAGLEDFRLHDARHTAGTLMHDRGASLVEVGAVLGHQSVVTTSRYAHAENLERAVDLLDDES